MPELETMNKLYLELSQFCTGITQREIKIRKKIALAIQALGFPEPDVGAAIRHLKMAKAEYPDCADHL